jgi:3alpha(or 20beta)-hydroxysteroid dehydrogenase
MGRLDDKVALVTGAARGTGAAIAQMFADEGARVVIADVLDDRGNETAEKIGDAARFRHHDVTNERDWNGAVEELRAQEGSLDVLVNDAAVLHLSSIDDTTPETFETVFRVNCLGPFIGTRACLPLLRETRGAIVNIGSINSLISIPGTVAYTAAKFGLRGLTKATALENGKYGVRANIVCPAGGNLEMHESLVGKPPVVRTAEEQAVADGAIRAPAAQTPAGIDLTRIAAVALFLATEDARYCNGAEFICDNGMNAGPVIDIPGVWTSAL